MPSRRQEREDRRSFQRVAKVVRMRVRKVKDADDTDFEVESVNLAVGGLCLRFKERIPAGTVIRINFTQLEPRGHGFQVDGRVIWCQFSNETKDYHVGVQLIAMTDEQLHRLLLLIADSEWHATEPPPPLRLRPSATLIADYRRAKGLLKGSWTPAPIEEISLREMVLVAEKRLPPRTELELRFLLPDQVPEPLPCRGVVLDEKRAPRPGEWSHTIRFTEMADLNRMRLAAFLSREVMM